CTRRYFLLQHAAHVAFDKRGKIAESRKLRVSANAVGRASPDGVEYFMKQKTAFQSRKAGFSRVPLLSIETRCCEGLEGASRLGSKYVGTTGDLARRVGKLHCVVERNGKRILDCSGCEICRKRLGQTCDLHHEPRRARLHPFALPRVAEVNLGRRGKHTACHGIGKIPIELWRGVRHSGFALDPNWNECMRRAGRGPRLFARAQKPDGIGGQARGLRRARNQDWRVLRLGREQCFIDGAIQCGKKIVPRDAAAIEAERRAVIHSLLPAAESLEFGAGECAGTGPARHLKELSRKLSPCQRSLQSVRKLL